jgi:hypothetical protein
VSALTIRSLDVFSPIARVDHAGAEAAVSDFQSVHLDFRIERRIRADGLLAGFRYP